MDQWPRAQASSWEGEARLGLRLVIPQTTSWRVLPVERSSVMRSIWKTCWQWGKST